jgi:flagellar assembly factor FliW
MRIETDELGAIEASDETRVYFPEGLFGFEEYQHFLLVDHEAYRPFAWLVSEEDPRVRFAVTDADRFRAGSDQLSLSPTDEEALDLTEGDAISVFVIISLRAGEQRVTGNLRAPIVMNTRNRLARQVIVYGAGLGLRQPMLSHRLVPLHSAVGVGTVRK